MILFYKEDCLACIEAVDFAKQHELSDLLLESSFDKTIAHLVGVTSVPALFTDDGIFYGSEDVINYLKEFYEII